MASPNPNHPSEAIFSHFGHLISILSLQEVMLHGELFHRKLFQLVSIKDPATAGHLRHAQA